MTAGIKRRAAKIRLVILDVDGVLTDGKIILDHKGNELKHFNVQDGHGVTLARGAGMKFAIISGRKSAPVTHRARQMKIDKLYQGVREKEKLLPELLRHFGVSAGEIAFVGDDTIDIPLMRLVGLPVAVKNAMPAVKRAAVYVTKLGGGEGAVRETLDLILSARKTSAGI